MQQQAENINKLLLVVMFPFFEVKDSWHYGQSILFPAFRCGKYVLVRVAIGKGIMFDYMLVDSWFTCFSLVKFVATRRIGCH